MLLLLKSLRHAFQPCTAKDWISCLIDPGEPPQKTRLVKLVIPYEQGSVRSMLHEEGKILNEEFAAEGVHIEAEVDEALYGKVRNFLHIV